MYNNSRASRRNPTHPHRRRRREQEIDENQRHTPPSPDEATAATGHEDHEGQRQHKLPSSFLRRTSEARRRALQGDAQMASGSNSQLTVPPPVVPSIPNIERRYRTLSPPLPAEREGKRRRHVHITPDQHQQHQHHQHNGQTSSSSSGSGSSSSSRTNIPPENRNPFSSSLLPSRQFVPPRSTIRLDLQRQIAEEEEEEEAPVVQRIPSGLNVADPLVIPDGLGTEDSPVSEYHVVDPANANNDNNNYAAADEMTEFFRFYDDSQFTQIPHFFDDSSSSSNDSAEPHNEEGNPENDRNEQLDNRHHRSFPPPPPFIYQFQQPQPQPQPDEDVWQRFHNHHLFMMGQPPLPPAIPPQPTPANPQTQEDQDIRFARRLQEGEIRRIQRRQEFLRHLQNDRHLRRQQQQLQRRQQLQQLQLEQLHLHLLQQRNDQHHLNAEGVPGRRYIMTQMNELLMHHAPRMGNRHLAMLNFIDRDFNENDYELLSRLDDTVPKKCVPSFVKSIPTEEAARDLESCTICLDDIKKGCEIKKMPCTHIFHAPCINTWLGEYGSKCPMCLTDFKM